LVTVPSSLVQLLVTLLFVVPGFVYQGVLISRVGRTPADLDLSMRVLRAIATSTLFGLVYVVFLGQPLLQAAEGQGPLVENPRVGALAAAAGGFVIPAVAALLQARIQHGGASTHDPTPSAWDYTFKELEPCYIRVRMQDGTWFAGWFGPRSYATSFPDRRELFVEIEHHVDTGGVIGAEIEGSAGAVIDCEGAWLIEVVRPLSDAVASDAATTDHGEGSEHGQDPSAAARGLPR
jgi:hypothetical protein